MNIRKLIANAVGVLAAAFAVAGGAHAQVVQFASMTGGDNTFTYTGGTGGGLALSTSGFFASLDRPVAGTVINNPAIVTFTGLANSGTVSTVLFNGATQFAQNLTGGTFTITNSTGTTVLLSGTFGGATLSGVLGTNQAGVDTNFNNVMYTGGTYAAAANIALGMNVNDKFNFSLINTTPTLSQNGSYVSNFRSAGNGQFTGATAVPEPGTYAAFAFTGLGVMGLMLRARKSRGSMAA